MPGTTPVYGFPYPEPTDLVANYPALGQQLAEDIETVISGLPFVSIVAATYSTQTSTNSSAFADTGLSATITPSSASNKILILVNQTGLVKETNNTWVDLILLRGSTNIASFGTSIGRTASSAFNGVGGNSAAILDSPATTASVTYKTQFRSNQNNAVGYVQFESSVSSIVLIEVQP